jgi:outer membrane protein assembly factor BamB
MKTIFDTQDNIIATSVLKKIGGFVIAGTALKGNYRILFMEINEKGNVLRRRTYCNDSADAEGHGMIQIPGGYLICGCSGGRASSTGGKGWKAHILKVDRHGKKIWEQSYVLYGNDCAYSLALNGGIFLLGEARERAKRGHLFLIKTDIRGKMRWKKIIGCGDDILPGGIVRNGKCCIIAGSMKTAGGWRIIMSKVNSKGETLWEKMLTEGRIYCISKSGNGILMAGDRKERAFTVKTDMHGKEMWKREYFNGCWVTAENSGGSIIIGGEIRKGRAASPMLCRINSSGAVEWKWEYGSGGFIEAIARKADGYLLAVHHLLPEERSIFTAVNEKGEPED